MKFCKVAACWWRNTPEIFYLLAAEAWKLRHLWWNHSWSTFTNQSHPFLKIWHLFKLFISLPSWELNIITPFEMHFWVDVCPFFTGSVSFLEDKRFFHPKNSSHIDRGQVGRWCASLTWLVRSLTIAPCGRVRHGWVGQGTTENTGGFLGFCPKQKDWKEKLVRIQWSCSQLKFQDDSFCSFFLKVVKPDFTLVKDTVYAW